MDKKHSLTILKKTSFKLKTLCNYGKSKHKAKLDEDDFTFLISVNSMSLLYVEQQHDGIA